MKATGMVRRLNDLGQFVIPKEIRKAYGWEQGDALEIFTDADGVYIRRYAPGCRLCGSLDGLQQVAGKNLCASCVSTIKSAG